MPKQVQRSLLVACGSMFLSSPLLGQNASRAEQQALVDQKNARPNIVVILADDLGFSDLGAYGSEIQTPNLDRLAERGIKFSNYHTAPSCAPSRAMLLTGVNSHRAGVPNIPEALPPEQKLFDNYNGVLGSNVATVASRLNAEGYHTYMTGKWHLGKTVDLLPYNRGFERTLSMADTGADNWEQKPYLPVYDHAHWTRDGKPTQLEEPFYSSELLVDEMISYIESNRGDGQPFFSYLSFLAVHLPMQAPSEFTERYIETYADGWENLRESRHAGAIAAGLVPTDTKRVDHNFIDDWDALNEADKRFASKRMAVYAGMVSAMDYHIGRLLDYLEASGELDNTVVIFTSDNGPEFGILPPGILRSQGYTHTYDNLGEIGSASFLGPNFANAAASPLRYFKFYMGEGGMRVPLIISGPGIQAQKGFNRASTHVIDLTPTILSLAGIEARAGRFGGRKVETITGRDLSPILRGSAEEVYGADDYVGYEVAGNASLFSGRYKIVMNRQPLGDGRWQMFDIVADPGETRDLSAENPVQFQRMLNLYIRHTRENGVQPVPENYMQENEINNQNLHKLFGDRILVGLLTALTLSFFALLAIQRKKRWRSTVMKNHLLSLYLILLAPILLEAQQLPAGWDSWKTQVLQSAGSLELDSLLISDLDAGRKELRKRTIPRLLAARSLNEPHEALPDNMAVSNLPGLFFALPWQASSAAYTEPHGETGRTLVSMGAEMGQVVNGELLYVTNSGQLVETRIRFNNQPLPSIIVKYTNGQITSMVIISIPNDPPADGVYRETQFFYK